jgi:hypothetical protein
MDSIHHIKTWNRTGRTARALELASTSSRGIQSDVAFQRDGLAIFTFSRVNLYSQDGLSFVCQRHSDLFFSLRPI